jgi:signal peptidase II
MFKNIKKMTALYTAVIFFVALDRFFKVLAFTGQAMEFNIVGDLLKFAYKANYYIAFSLPLAGSFLLILVVLIIVGLIIYGLVIFKKHEFIRLMPLVIIILGASSNLYDRIKYGFVIDYLDLKYFTVFNLADVMIVTGVILLIIMLYKKEAD